MSELTAHEVLVKARNLLNDEGDWRQGHKGYGNGEAPYCAMEAASVAAGSRSGDLGEEVAIDALVVLQEVTGELVTMFWNDAPERTHAEVLAAYDRAIAATAPEPDVSFVTEPVAVA